MSKYEERVYISGNAKKSITDLRNQVATLKRDIEQYSARKPGGPMVTALKDQIRKLEAEIADAEATKKRERDARAAAQDGEGQGEDGSSGRSMRSTSSRFPPRRRAP